VDSDTTFLRHCIVDSETTKLSFVAVESDSLCHYGVASISRLLKIIGLFCKISSLLYGSFAKETYNFNAGNKMNF